MPEREREREREKERERESRERERVWSSSIIVQTLAAQSRVRARQDRAGLDWAWVVQYLIYLVTNYLL